MPLAIPVAPPARPGAIAGRIALAVVTLVLAAIWIWAERMIVTGDDWPWWDHTWIAAAVLTLLAVAWLAWDAIRRGRANGWDRAWRLWEPPLNPW